MILVQGMKGLDKLRYKLPDYQGRKIWVFLLIALCVFVSSIAFQLFMDSLPRLFRNIGALLTLAPFTPIIGKLLVITIGFLIVRKFWRIKDEYLANYGIKAYQKAFKFVAIGIPMVLSSVFHNFFPNNFIIPYINDGTSNHFLGTSINFPYYILFIRLILFIIFVGTGVLVFIRTLSIFGIDYMALLYVFYPEESKLQNHEIYSILRHPTYHGIMLISIGSIFFRFSIYSVIYFLIFIVGINLHLKYVEEKELILRFGKEYEKYRETVPAFFVRLKDVKKYFSILLSI